MRKITLLLTLFTFTAAAVIAQQRQFLRYDCMAAAAIDDGHRSPSLRHLPTPPTKWDSTRTYPVAVVLVAFADKSFSSEDPADRYHRMFNEEGYNEGRGPGCVADYFRDQSSGLFRPSFDIYGPVTLGIDCTGGGRMGGDAFKNAVTLLDDSLHVDFEPYDWNGDKSAESVIFIFAGYGGNESSTQNKGYIWPNTGSFSAVTTAGGIRVSGYSASAELWSNYRSCGIGTICHEYSHTLGLPDIYPTNSGSDEYSVCDEWDLMDGGNFVNSGWCPPAYTAHEKMQLGWLTPVELSEPTFVTDMRTAQEGGPTYIIRTADASEFFLLENRQWSRWDLRTPGHGLLVSHVHYDSSAWRNNRVNNIPDHHRFDFVHADGLSYSDWADIVGDNNPYVGGHSQFLSGTPYPLATDSTRNDMLTDDSQPAATTFTSAGLLSKPITEITEHDDGTISFHFMKPVDEAIASPSDRQQPSVATYDLQGRRLQGQPRRGIYIDSRRRLVTVP